MKPTRPTLNRLNTPFGQRTDGTESAAKAVEGAVQGLKTVVHEAVAWTQMKAEVASVALHSLILENFLLSPLFCRRHC
jgi:hypothetical protein